jgi:hypothetical protein
MLLLLTALFSEGHGKPNVLLFDEPELSLHPRPLAAFVRAVRAATGWGKQVLIATHSPALLSQFEPSETLATSLRDGRTEIKRLSEMEEIRELLREYPTGSLYMAEVVGAPAPPAAVAGGESCRTRGRRVPGSATASVCSLPAKGRDNSSPACSDRCVSGWR